uniref:Uncharacterized protein n=1 Tax=Arundo donax TaxID=35708 RepID=A0A0A8ZV14_ARUDO
MLDQVGQQMTHGQHCYKGGVGMFNFDMFWAWKFLFWSVNNILHISQTSENNMTIKSPWGKRPSLSSNIMADQIISTLHWMVKCSIVKRCNLDQMDVP